MIPASPKGYLAPGAYGLRGPICVIPVGSLPDGDDAPWTAEELRPYAAGGPANEPLFRSFVFNGVRVRDNRYLYPLYTGFGELTDRTDWQLLIQELFRPGVNLSALREAAGNDIRDVWIALPYPHPFQRQFGLIGRAVLDFQEKDDRLKAAAWWLDALLAEWRAHPELHDKLQLRGVLWQREAIDGNDEELVKAVNREIAARGFLSMWLPNYGSYGVTDWSKLGFHVAALNSNYYGNTSYGLNWIQNATMFARYYHTGMQINWGKGLIYNDTHFTDYLNFGLPEKTGYMSDSLLVFQFPNQRLGELRRTRPDDYGRLQAFVKGVYTRTDYPGISY